MKPTIDLKVAGETMVARGDRTLFWPAESTLFAADVHLGKGAAFRAGGVPLPMGSTASDLAALGRALDASGARRLVILGDLWHARAGRTKAHREEFAAWAAARDVRIRLVIGNHDRHAGWDVDAAAPGARMGPFVLQHEPEPNADGYVLSGHLHPGVVLGGRGGESLRVPCFWFGERVGVLPAFGELTGAATIRPAPGDRVLVVADDLVGILPSRDRPGPGRRWTKG